MKRLDADEAFDPERLPWQMPRYTELTLSADELEDTRRRLLKPAERQEQDDWRRAGIGDNGPPVEPDVDQQAEAESWKEATAPPTAREKFDTLIAENLRAFHSAQRDMLLKAVPDHRLQPRHRAVLAAATYLMNKRTGTCYPSYQHLADLTGYSIDTVRVTVAELRRLGYLATARYAPKPGKKALAHYTVVKPDKDEILASVAGKAGDPDFKPQAIEDSLRDQDIEDSKPEFNAQGIEDSGRDQSIEDRNPDFKPQSIEDSSRAEADFNADPTLSSMPSNYTVTGKRVTGREEDNNHTRARTREGLPATFEKVQTLVPIELFEQYCRLLNQTKPGAARRTWMERDATDASLNALLELHVKAGHKPVDVVKAVTETFTECALMECEGRNPGAACARYINKTVASKLEAAALSRIKVDTEEQAKNKKLGALGTSIASNQARRERTGSATGIGVGRQLITPADIQLVVAAVEGATEAEAEAAYREVSRKLHKGNPSKADVVDAAVEHLRAQKLHVQFGTPAQQIDVAKTKCGDVFEARWWAISEAKLGSLLDQYPSTSEGDAWRFFGKLQDEIEAPHERYGRGLQAEVESALAAKLAHRHAEIQAEVERKRQELQAEAERKRQDEEDALLWKQADEQARERRRVTPGDWARLTGSGERKQLTKIEFDRLKREQRNG